MKIHWNQSLKFGTTQLIGDNITTLLYIRSDKELGMAAYGTQLPKCDSTTPHTRLCLPAPLRFPMHKPKQTTQKIKELLKSMASSCHVKNSSAVQVVLMSTM